MPADLPDELIQTLLATPNVRIERIVSLGQRSPKGFWFDQPEHEWVLVVCGAARLKIEGQDSVDMTPGCFLNIPAHTRHRVEWTDPAQPTVWLAIYYSS